MENDARMTARPAPWLLLACVLLLCVACGTPPSLDAGVIALDSGSDPVDAGGTEFDAGPTAVWPMPLGAGQCTRVRADLPNNTWENSSVFDTRAQKLVLSGGHVLGGYPQSAYTFRFGTGDFHTEPSRAARGAQRRCLVDGAWAGSLGRSVFAHGLLEHGSINPGNFKDAFTRIALAETPGPWLYDAVADDWLDARPLETQFDQRQHAPMTWDPATDTIASLRQTQLQLYHLPTNRVLLRALPLALQGRLFYGIAADPIEKRLVVVGGSTGRFLSQPGDAGAGYELSVKGDTWLYDAVTDSWEEVVTPVRPPRGVPGQDFVKFSMGWEPVTGNVLFRVNPLERYVANATQWPEAETWAFNVRARQWVKLELNGAPPFVGQLSVDPLRSHVLILGGGRDANTRPSLSRELVDCTLPTAGPPLASTEPTGLSVETTAAGARLRWQAVPGREVVIFRATTAPWPLGFVEVDRLADVGEFFDANAPAGTASAWEVRVAGHPAAPAVMNRPLRPEGLWVSVESATRTHLEWKASAEPDVVGYRVYRGRGGDQRGVSLTPQPVSAPRFVDDAVNLTDGVMRRYWVIAVNRGGYESGASPQAFTMPEAPLAATIVPSGPGSFTVSWSAPVDSRVTRFEVFHINVHRNTLTEPDPFGPNGWYAQAGAVVPFAVNAGRSYTFTVDPLDVAPHHYFWVRAVNALGQAGFFTDILSATDRRFVPQVSASFAPP